MRLRGIRQRRCPCRRGAGGSPFSFRVMQGNRAGHKGYGMTVLGTKGKLVGGEKQSYVPLAQAMMAFFQGDPAPVSLDDTVEILAFMEAADRALGNFDRLHVLESAARAADGMENFFDFDVFARSVAFDDLHDHDCPPRTKQSSRSRLH